MSMVLNTGQNSGSKHVVLLQMISIILRNQRDNLDSVVKHENIWLTAEKFLDKFAWIFEKYANWIEFVEGRSA